MDLFLQTNIIFRFVEWCWRRLNFSALILIGCIKGITTLILSIQYLTLLVQSGQLYIITCLMCGQLRICIYFLIKTHPASVHRSDRYWWDYSFIWWTWHKHRERGGSKAIEKVGLCYLVSTIVLVYSRLLGYLL